ncbi:MAG TPA: Ig-like domain-containing protein, partial [Patescibacteria group bacterium]
SLSLTPAAFPTLGGSTIFNPQIITPQKDQSFKDPQPLFKGKAVPNANVTITINSTQTITSTVQTDANGNWQYRPDIPLDPGTHTITMSTLDASGLIKTISQSFTVYAAGSQFTEPSISPTQAVTPTTIPTVTPTINPTATGTPAPTVTKTPSPITTKIPSVSPTNPPVPVTGSNNSLLLSVAGGISAVGVGALLFFLTAL